MASHKASGVYVYVCICACVVMGDVFRRPPPSTAVRLYEVWVDRGEPSRPCPPANADDYSRRTIREYGAGRAGL